MLRLPVPGDGTVTDRSGKLKVTLVCNSWAGSSRPPVPEAQTAFSRPPISATPPGMALLRSVATVGSYTALSRVFGFVRDVLTAAILGAGPVADAFFVAQRLPNLFR